MKTKTTTVKIGNTLINKFRKEDNKQVQDNITHKSSKDNLFSDTSSLRIQE